MEKISDKQTFSGILWKIMESAGAQGVKFVIQIVLARLLMPEEYGLIAIVASFITVMEVMVQGGLNTALIQKKNADELDFSTVLTVSLIVAALLYVVLFLSAPLIALFYRNEALIRLIRVYGISAFFSAYLSIQLADLTRKMLFRKNFVSTLIAALVSGAISICMAMAGWGVWALVMQQIMQQIVSIIILTVLLRSRIKLGFSAERFKTLFTFGWKVMTGTLIGVLTENAYSLLIGRYYSENQLGYYTRGHQFPNVLVGNINNGLNTVLLPAYVSVQDQKESIVKSIRRTVSISTFLILPMMAGMAAVARPLVESLLTEKWLGCVPFLQLECIFYATLPMNAANAQASRAIGRSDVSMKIESCKAVISIACLALFYKYGIIMVCMLRATVAVIVVIIYSFIIQRLFGYTLLQRLSDIMAPVIMSAVMGVIVYLIQLFNMNCVLTLVIQITTGIALYVAMSVLFKPKCYKYLLGIIRQY